MVENLASVSSSLTENSSDLIGWTRTSILSIALYP